MKSNKTHLLSFVSAVIEKFMFRFFLLKKWAIAKNGIEIWRNFRTLIPTHNFGSEEESPNINMETRILNFCCRFLIYDWESLYWIGVVFQNFFSKKCWMFSFLNFWLKILKMTTLLKTLNLECFSKKITDRDYFSLSVHRNCSHGIMVTNSPIRFATTTWQSIRHQVSVLMKRTMHTFKAATICTKIDFISCLFLFSFLSTIVRFNPTDNSVCLITFLCLLCILIPSNDFSFKFWNSFLITFNWS